VVDGWTSSRRPRSGLLGGGLGLVLVVILLALQGRNLVVVVLFLFFLLGAAGQVAAAAQLGEVDAAEVRACARYCQPSEPYQD